MTGQLFEIVPNLSEGRDPETIDAAAAAVERTGARLIDRSSDAVHHRSVLTVVGNADQVVAAAVALAGIALDRIDLRAHRGAHPRIGALDVLPFVPLMRAGLPEAVALAHRAGAEIWRRYGVPSFYYGAASRRSERALLPDIRRNADWAPDEGDVMRHHSAGAIAIGARDLLIAFNVELESNDLAAAAAIARTIRERNGGLRSLRALAFPRAEGRVQVSLNITDYAATPLYRIVELIRALAAARGIELLRCELIGCLPWAAVEATAAYYLGVSNL
ncbi:MAG: glutamate formimidoyltransferase [Candidatus Eremiobacteraeota bacterium]|nr:glutamate formimidoyltransferase [Candidatus Eremiobacteraeota bacterium]MBV8499475.1 glutamate formimidoyltransferase [Candidatus Eremiobacteraeota bacterium]